MSGVAKHWFSYEQEVGALMGFGYEHRLRDKAQRAGLEIMIERLWSLTSSLYTIKLSGDDDTIAEFFCERDRVRQKRTRLPMMLRYTALVELTAEQIASSNNPHTHFAWKTVYLNPRYIQYVDVLPMINGAVIVNGHIVPKDAYYGGRDMPIIVMSDGSRHFIADNKPSDFINAEIANELAREKDR